MIEQKQGWKTVIILYSMARHPVLIAYNLCCLNSRFVLQGQVLTGLLTAWIIPLKPFTLFSRNYRETNNISALNCRLRLQVGYISGQVNEWMDEKYVQRCNWTPAYQFIKLWHWNNSNFLMGAWLLNSSVDPKPCYPYIWVKHPTRFPPEHKKLWLVFVSVHIQHRDQCLL